MLLVYIVKTDSFKRLKPNMALHMQERGLGWIIGRITNGRTIH